MQHITGFMYVFTYDLEIYIAMALDVHWLVKHALGFVNMVAELEIIDVRRILALLALTLAADYYVWKLKSIRKNCRN